MQPPLLLPLGSGKKGPAELLELSKLDEHMRSALCRCLTFCLNRKACSAGEKGAIKSPELAELDKQLGGLLTELVELQEFTGKVVRRPCVL